MITRGIITYSDSENMKVYIPILQGLVEEKYLTEVEFNERFQGLPVVSVLSTPGINVDYKPGDVVLVGFQDNEMSSVVVLGYLGSAIDESSQLSIKASKLNVTGQINFSTDVVFGNDKINFNQIFSKIKNKITEEDLSDNLRKKIDIYPGYVYISVSSESPAKLFGGQWLVLPAGKVLQTVSTDSTAGTEIAAGLPNITGQIGTGNGSALFYSSATSGAFANVGATNLNYAASGSSSTGDRTATVEFSAENSNSIYGNSDTVQPPAYTIYAWKFLHW